MYRRAFSFLLALLFGQEVFAQFSIRGSIQDLQAGRPLAGAAVRLRRAADTAFSLRLLSDSLGRFEFQNRQNQSIARNVTETYIEDTQNQVLRQYFLLQFTYNLHNFGTAPGRTMNRTNGNRSFGAEPRF